MPPVISKFYPVFARLQLRAGTGPVLTGLPLLAATLRYGKAARYFGLVEARQVFLCAYATAFCGLARFTRFANVLEFGRGKFTCCEFQPICRKSWLAVLPRLTLKDYATESE
jgi:hypothetical protein